MERRRRLQECGLVERNDLSDTALHVGYKLTSTGQKLAGIIEKLHALEARHAPGIPETSSGKNAAPAGAFGHSARPEREFFSRFSHRACRYTISCMSRPRHRCGISPMAVAMGRGYVQRTSSLMPKSSTVQRAQRDAREGKKPTTQAGEFVREEMEKFESGSGNVRSRKQAIAIGLSEARRAGIKLGTPKKAASGTRKKAQRDAAVGEGRYKPSPTRSQGAKKAARTRARKYAHPAKTK